MTSSAIWIDEYERMLISPGDFQPIVDLKAKHFPKSIFKYRDVNPYNLDALRNNYVWFAAPKTMNDPYDSACKVDESRIIAAILRKDVKGALARMSAVAGMDFSTVFDEAELREIENTDDPQATLVRKLLTKFGTEQEKAKIEQFIEAMKNVERVSARKMVEATFDFAREHTKIASFCSDGDSPQLWAYYAADGRGYCVENEVARIPADNIRLRSLIPVIYKGAPFDATDAFIAGVKHGPNALTVRWPFLVASYKDARWSHEREWRIVETIGSFEPGTKIAMPPPKAVYLGMNMSKENAAQVSDIAKVNGAAVYRMRRGFDASHLEFDPA